MVEENLFLAKIIFFSFNSEMKTSFFWPSLDISLVRIKLGVHGSDIFLYKDQKMFSPYCDRKNLLECIGFKQRILSILK